MMVVAGMLLFANFEFMRWTVVDAPSIGAGAKVRLRAYGWPWLMAVENFSDKTVKEAYSKAHQLPWDAMETKIYPYDFEDGIYLNAFFAVLILILAGLFLEVGIRRRERKHQEPRS